MISSKLQKTFTYILLGSVLLMLFFCSVISPPFHGYYTTDENFVADSGVLLWYGNTPRGLDWPAAPHMLFYYIAFGFSCLISVVQNAGNIHGLMSVFDIFDAEVYAFLKDREPYILFGRAVQILAVGFILYQTIRTLYSQNHALLTDAAKLFLPVLFITSTLVLEASPVLRPEAISGNLFILLLAGLLFRGAITIRQIAVYSAIFGLILAERLIFAFFLPFYIGAVYLLATHNKIKRVFFSIGFILISFLLFCPFIISDTLVVMKSFVGGIIAKINDKPMHTVFNIEYITTYLKRPVHVVTVILSGLGVFKLLTTRKPMYFLLLANMAVFLVLVLRSSLIYDTHVLPAGVITLFLVGLGLSFIVERSKTAGPGLTLVMMLFIVLTKMYDAYEYQARVHKKLNMHEACAWIRTLPSETRMLVNPEFEFYIPKSQSCLQREQALNTDSDKMIRKINYLLGRKAGVEVEGKNLPIIANAFAFEDERQYDTQYKILLKYTPADTGKVYDYDVYFNSVELASHSIQTEKAFQDFREGKYAYLITERKQDDLKPLKVFDKQGGQVYYVYEQLKK